jgi:hypothetical protein
MAGLRLPLEHFPEGLPRQVLTLETDGESWDLFLPPLFRRPLTALLQAVADSLAGLAPPCAPQRQQRHAHRQEQREDGEGGR